MINLPIVLLILLGIVALVDWKFKSVPSAFLTGIILLTAVTHFYEFEIGLISLAFGILSFVYGWMLYEADFFGGIADVKVVTIIGLMMPNFLYFFAMMLLILIFGMTYKLVFRYVLKKKKHEVVPFILPIYAVYVTLLLIGGVV